jgi:hypothetical protein
MIMSNLTLYEINQKYLQLYDEIENEGGVLSDELAAELELTESNLLEKANNYWFFMRETSDRIEKGKEYIEQMKNKIKSMEKAYERCEENIIAVMKTVGKEEMGGIHRFKISKSERVEVTDVNLLPKKYKVVKTEVKPDKNAIKAALKAKMKIAGCSLVPKDNLQLK